MGITSADVKLLKSQLLLDEPDGGGAMTGNEVIDGESNNLFPDISQLDRVYGRIALRKAFPAVQYNGRDSYYGAHVIIDVPPQDPLVSAAIFTTSDWFDHRSEAASRVESYLIPGQRLNGELFGNHLTGQRSVTIHMPVDADPPAVGQTLYLVSAEGLADEKHQYVRTVSVASEVQHFTVMEGSMITIDRLVVVCEISDPLRYDFEAPELTRRYLSDPPTKIRDTVVADAAQYCGIQPLTAEGALGDLHVDVANIYTQLVPSTRAETPLTDYMANGERATPTDGSSSNISMSFSAQLGQGHSICLHTGVRVGSLTLTAGSTTITDKAGSLYVSTTAIGAIDYQSGVLEFTSAQTPAYTGAMTATFLPAAYPITNTHTTHDDVTVENNGYIWQKTLQPYPAPQTTQVSYRALGNWYTLRDVGGGVMRGTNPNYGVGTVDYATGTVSITTGALPDVGSAILWAWSAPSMMITRAPATVKPYWEHTIYADGSSVDPNTVTLTMTIGATTYTIVDDGLGGLIKFGTTDSWGTIDYADGIIHLEFPEVLPAIGQSVQIAVTKREAAERRTVQFTDPVEPYNFVLPDTNILPGSIRVTHTLRFLHNLSRYISVYDADNGNGSFIKYGGTVDYTNGALLLQRATGSVFITWERWVRPVHHYVDGRIYEETPYTVSVTSNELISDAYEFIYVKIDVSYYVVGAILSSDTQTATIDALLVDLTNAYNEQIVTGSIRFNLGGWQYIDRDGHVMTSLQPDGSAMLAGSVNYLTCLVTLTSWNSASASVNAEVLSLVATIGDPPQSSASSFLIPVAPVRPGTVQVRGVSPTLGEILATADSAGTINDPNMQGFVNYNTGVGWVSFGAYVVAAGHESEWWYDAARVRPDGTIWRPEPVIASTLRYNAVGYTYLPLSAEVLGIDPVRLPVDGRVPIYRNGDVVVIHNTQTAQFPVDPPAGYVLNCGRVRLESAYIEDANSVKLPTANYTTDLDAGTVTLVNNNLTGYVQPIRCVHRVEDMALVTDAQISGRLSLSAPISHVYPAGSSYCSSAIVIGDMQASVDTIFDQQTWTGVWSDALIGNSCTAEYNSSLYPIEVTDAGALEERWIIKFTASTTFVVVGEHIGQVASGDIANDCSPMNPTTGVPYFIIRAGGWGGGWATGNVLRFNTRGANAPIWIARTVLQGEATLDDDRFRIQIRGDVDRP